MKTGPLSPLAAAAEALDAELSRYEALTAGVGRERLDTEKSLRRAAQALQDIKDSEGRLGTHLQALAAALLDVRKRQQEHAEAVQRRADEIGARSARLTDLLTRWQALGEAAREISRLVRTMDGEAAQADTATALGDLEGRLVRIADDAAQLVHAAEADGFADLARQAEGLRMQLVSVRNKFRLMQSGEQPEKK